MITPITTEMSAFQRIDTSSDRARGLHRKNTIMFEVIYWTKITLRDLCKSRYGSTCTSISGLRQTYATGAR